MMEFAQDWQRTVFVLALSIPRMLVIFNTLPFLRSEVFPGLVRSSFAIGMAALAYPIVESGYPAEGLTAFTTVGILLKEVFVGLAIGYTVAVLFWVVESVGFLVDTQRGATMAGALMPTFGEQSSPLANFLGHTVAVLFIVGGGFLVFLDVLLQSYSAWPVFSFFPTLGDDLALFFLSELDLLMYLTLFLAAPMLIAMFISELALGVIGRFVPQLQVFFLALPIKSAVAFFVLALYVGVVLRYVNGQFAQTIDLSTRLEGLF